MFRSVYAGVTSRPLLVVLAAVFAGLAMLLFVGAAVSGQPLVLLAAVPLVMTAGLMWYQGTGRLASGMFGRAARTRRRTNRRTRRRRRHSDPRTTDGGASGSTGGAARASARGGRGARGDDGSGGRGDPWERSFDEEARREARHHARREARRRARSEESASQSRGAWDQRRTSRRGTDRHGGMSRAEAYDVLGLDRSATDEEVREAYREQAKTLHPDTDGGSTEEFQELNDAYERLVDE